MPAAGTVTGSVTTNGDKAVLVRAYVDESPDDIIIVLASKDVPPDVVPFIGEEVARRLKIHAVVFTVSRATRKIVRSFGGVFYPGPEMGFVGMGESEAALQVKRLDKTGIEGRVFTPKRVSVGDLMRPVRRDLQHPARRRRARPTPVIVKISGDTSEPARAYAEYDRAALAGDVDKIRAALAAESRKQFDADDATTRGMFVDVLKSNPAEIRIGKPTVAGGEATLTVEGLNETAGKSTGIITMVQEGGAWKVAKEKWESR